MFILASLNDANSTVNSHRKYFLPRAEIKNCNIEIDGINIYDQPINDLIKQYHEVRKYQQDKVILHNWLVIGFYLI